MFDVCGSLKPSSYAVFALWQSIPPLLKHVFSINSDLNSPLWHVPWFLRVTHGCVMAGNGTVTLSLPEPHSFPIQTSHGTHSAHRWSLE